MEEPGCGGGGGVAESGRTRKSCVGLLSYLLSGCGEKGCLTLWGWPLFDSVFQPSFTLVAGGKVRAGTGPGC